MGKLFDRDLPIGNRFDGLLTAMRSPQADEGLQAIAVNWMADHRVTLARQATWEATLPSEFTPLTQAQLNSAVVGYYQGRVRDPVRPDFLAAHNKINIVYGEIERPEISGDTALVHCLDLTGLHWVLQRRKEAQDQYLNDTDYPASVSVDHGDVKQWHQERLQDRNTEVSKTHVERILNALSAHIDAGNYYHPGWASIWEKFSRQLRPDDSPNRWKELCGIGNCNIDGRWVILLKYSARECGTLLRPSVLDAGWYQYHFPSPRGVPASMGGHPVDLNPGNPSRILPEFIHQQIRLQVQHWLNCERMAGVTVERPDGPPRKLPDLRRRHHSLLVREYPDLPVTGWMPHPTQYDSPAPEE